MKLREEILKEHSKAQCNKIVEWVGKSQLRFDELFHLFISDENLVVQRASWPVSYCVENFPSLIDKHYTSLIKKLQEPGVHEAVKRNSMRLLEVAVIPEEHEGSIMDLAFQFLASPTASVATKAFSVSVLENLAKRYPEIIPEIKTILESQPNNKTASINARAKRLFKKFKIA
ncbi:MAG TPA: hypothetical protein PK504_02630 [Ferruginibacter sp.]|nr:hypothetical protein [Ferruginibacter sp.]HRE62189.1 hypothetical protein [Ferruginibacter sp.]